MVNHKKRELQESLLEFLPNNIRITKELTRSVKILLGALIFLNGMDKARINGYVFRSNEKLHEDTQLSKHTIITSISKLIQLEFITRSTGNRVEGASTYILNFDKINSFNGCNFKGAISEKIAPINCTNKLHLSVEDKIKAMSLEIKELKSMIVELKGLILQGCNFQNCTTDTDIDLDIDKIINNNIDHNTIAKMENNVIDTERNQMDNEFAEFTKLVDNDKLVVGGNTLHTFTVEDKFTITDNNTSIEDANNDIVQPAKVEIRANKENAESEVRTNTENDNLTSTVELSLEDVLRAQAEEENALIRETHTNQVNQGKSNSEVQQRYSGIFDRANNSIDKWLKTHDTEMQAVICEYIKLVEDMYSKREITPNQYAAFTRCIVNRWNKLFNGYVEYSKDKFMKKTPDPRPAAKIENKAPQSRETRSDVQINVESAENDQEAVKIANIAFLNRECRGTNRKFDENTLLHLIDVINSDFDDKETKLYWLDRYFNGVTHKFQWYIDLKKEQAYKSI